jgi:3D (Asp-Asp-Asp) domain-containing protein
MFGTVAAIALVWALAFPAGATGTGEPVSYETAVASGLGAQPTSPVDEGSAGDAVLPPEARALMDADPRWSAKVSLYHAGGGGATGDDSLGCRPIPMRTVAVDPRYIPRHTRLFIPETVGIQMPDGTVHDGYWYASDTGGAIKGQRIDLYTGYGRASMRPAMRFNQDRVTIVDAGRFDGCPPSWDRLPSQATLMASTGLSAAGSN